MDYSCDAEPSSTSYFVMKCATSANLQQSITSNEWACCRRKNPPHPVDLLSSAHGQGRVILVFSVSGQHGWHGFCESNFNHVSKKACETSESNHFMPCSPYDRHEKDECKSVETLKLSESSHEEELTSWYRFPVKWLVHYNKFNEYSCLDFKYTDNLKLPDGSPINKARNWQQLPSDVGQQLCRLIEEWHTQLAHKEEEKKNSLKPDSYFSVEHGILCKEEDTWRAILKKISEELGQIHLACPFGSQRYNCSVPGSDLDMFIVFQAKTVDVLGLDPPKQTIKNSHHEEVDYSVLELHRYCELLVKGDAKCVETLFLSDSPIVVTSSPAWQRLCQQRSLLLTKQCLDKHMQEINGTRGLKQFQQWKKANADTDKLTQKLEKLGYIVLRLLQNVRQMVTNCDMAVFRREASLEREELMAVRMGDYTYDAFMAIVDRYMEEIEIHKDNIKQNSEAAQSKVQEWLIECRLQDLKQELAIQPS